MKKRTNVKSATDRIPMNKSTSGARPVFDRERVFAEVDASNRRFEKYTADQRRRFAAAIRANRLGVHETCRVRH